MTHRHPRILITGASGYIGSALADEATRRGMEAVRCSRKAPDAPGWFRLEGLDAAALARVPLQCDAVVHLAGIAHREAAAQPSDAEYHEVNAVGAESLAKAARGRCGTFVLVSSIAALGPGVHRGGAAARPRPASGYGRSKLAAESLVRDALAGSTTSLRVVRLPAVHGPAAPGAISQLAAWVGHRRPVPSGCDGARRSVIGIDNACDFLLKAAVDARLDGMTVTPTDGPAPDVLDMARRIARVRGVRLTVVPCPRMVLRAAAGVAGIAGPRAAGIRRSLDRLLESHAVEDDTVASVVRWVPPLTLDEGLARAFGGRA